MYPRLPKSFKNVFPFKISVPSFVYPDDYIPNARMLGPFVDEIELLFFESHDFSLPSKETISELALIAGQFDFTYNVHLPTDLEPGSPDPEQQNRFADAITRIVDLTRPVSPSAYILHLPYNQGAISPNCDKGWQDCITMSIRQLLEKGIQSRKLAIETLDYPLEWIESIIRTHDLRVCLDVGHLIVNQQDVKETFHRFADMITMIHLHGVQNGKDHLPLTVYDSEWLDRIYSLFRTFTGTVSIEVFSFDPLSDSLMVLEKEHLRHPIEIPKNTRVSR
jgi:sugar phosphate isomerase/epimerase